MDTVLITVIGTGPGRHPSMLRDSGSQVPHCGGIATLDHYRERTS
jgi:hypothetical protein